MKHVIRALMIATVAVVSSVSSATIAAAQDNQRGQPKTPFSTADFAKLHWLEGTWSGTSEGESPMFERIRFSSDSTIDITYFADSPTGRETGTARVNLSVGRVYFLLGPGRWGATKVETSGVYFVPQVNAHNTFNWQFQSPNAWTSTSRTGMGGKDRVTVYQMTRVSP